MDDRFEYTPVLYAAINGQTAVLEKLTKLNRQDSFRGLARATYTEILYYRYVMVFNQIDHRYKSPRLVHNDAELIKEIDRLQQMYHILPTRDFPTQDILEDLEVFIEMYLTAFKESNSRRQKQIGFWTNPCKYLSEYSFKNLALNFARYQASKAPKDSQSQAPCDHIFQITPV